MPADLRAELTSLRSRFAELTIAHDRLSAEHAAVARNRKYWTSEALRLKRSNMLLAAAFNAKSGAVSEISSHSMWTKETSVLELMLGRWQSKDVAELMLRVIYKSKDDSGKRLFHHVPAALARLAKPGNLFDDISRVWHRARDSQVAEHLKVVYDAATVDALRLCNGWSWNRMRWVRDAFRWDWTATDKDGELHKVRRKVAPGSDVALPDFFPIKQMREVEDARLAGQQGNVQHEDGRGAEVANVDVALLRMVTQVQEQKLAGGFATSGMIDDPHIIILTGDGAGLTADDSGVDIAAIPGTVEGLNQSTHLVHRLALWRASEHAEHYDTVKLRSARIRPALLRLFASNGQLLKEDGMGSGVYVRFALTGDKPWLCHVLGRRSFGHDFFSPHCGCSEKKKHLYNFTFNKATHYDGVTFEERCNLALVPLWEALGLPEPTDWTVTCNAQARHRLVHGPPMHARIARVACRLNAPVRACMQVWTKRQVLAKRAECDRMTSAQYEAFDEKWSHDHAGQHFNRPPLLPYNDGMTLVDTLHAFINDYNDALTEAFHSHLTEVHTDKELTALQAKVRDNVNQKLKGWAEQGGASLALTFGEDGKRHVVNGPKLKAMMRHPTLLRDLVDAMRPLYELMMAKDHKLVRPQPLDLNDLMEAAAAEGAQATAPAQAAAAPPPPARGRGQKKKTGTGANLRRPVIMPGAGAGAGAAAQDLENARDAERDAGGASGAAATEVCTPCAIDDAETYFEKVSYMFLALSELWTFLHQNERNSSDINDALRAKRGQEASKLALEVERAILSCVGTKRRRTYAHDTVYGFYKLYKIFGKPYLGATEGNEHAHQESKHMFRNMCSKSSKRRSAILQLMDLVTVKRIVVHEVAAQLPRQAYTGMMTGLASGAGHKERPKKRSDLTCEDSKDALRKLAKIQHHVASPAVMDVEWNALVAKHNP